VVLAALAASKIFSAGVSYYGIGDLELLAKDTHKFESRYLDQLIGPYPAMAAVYRARSPLHRTADITAPVLLLQGMLDKVVPPNQAEAIYRVLKAKTPQTRCVYFDDEGHGFRKPHNQIAAIQAELAFYAELFLDAPVGDKMCK
jgi:dipeptidyl aminopeptidase/acylaminoacyl peptidase